MAPNQQTKTAALSLATAAAQASAIHSGTTLYVMTFFHCGKNSARGPASTSESFREFRSGG